MSAARLASPVALGLAVALLPTYVAAMADLPTRPLGAVRSLHHIQDQIAQGDAAAFQVQPGTISIVDGLFAAIQEGTLTDPDQRRAILAYAVSGGNPATFAGLYEALLRQIDDETETAISEAVADALLRRRVSDDPRVQPVAVGGMVGAGLALLNGINSEGTEVQIANLGQAVLLAPGTLIEESALRRLMPIHTSEGDHDAFLIAASRYARMFVNSPYASDFAASLVQGGLVLKRQDQFERLAEVIDFMPTAHRRSIVARQMRAAAVSGNFDLVRFFESRFVAEIEAGQQMASADAPPPDPADALRQRLYALMANIASADHEEVAAELDAIDGSELSAADRQLLEVARNVVREMTRPGASMAKDAEPRAPIIEAAPAAAQTSSASDGSDLGLPMQPAEGAVRTVLPGYGPASEPVPAAPETAAAPTPMAAPQAAAADPAQSASGAEAVPAEHRNFMSSARDMLRDVDSVLEEKGQ